VSVQRSTQAARRKSSFDTGDFVLYRDPELFWSGQPGHTFVCRVSGRWTGDRYDLVELATGRCVDRVEATFMRLLPAAEVMRDIDTAPLNEPDPASMTPAAVAWLRQHLAAEGGSTLPAKP